MTRVAIVGGAGRMGQVIAHGLSETAGVELAALVDLSEPAASFGAPWRHRLDELDEAIDVVVDFSTIAVARQSIDWCLARHVAAVIGTTGLRGEELDELAGRVDEKIDHVLVAANFSIGAVLAERFAVEAAPYFQRVEIVELHHDKKVDSPSGTSLHTARSIAAARSKAGLEPIVDTTEHETVAQARGAEGPGGVRVHSVRLPGLVAHQEVVFGAPGEGLTIRHDSFDRVSFVGGVVLAVRAVVSRPGLTVGIDDLV